MTQAVPTVATPDQRKAALAASVGASAHMGWFVQSQTDYQVVLVRPGTKENHILHLLLTIVTLGLWAIVWICIAIFKRRDKVCVFQVDAYGRVHQS